MLDDIDAAIAELLEEDGRLSYSELARRAHVSRAVAAERTQRLIREGAVNIRAVVNPQVSGRSKMGYLRLRVAGSAAEAAERIAQLPRTSFVSTVTGPENLVAEVRASSRAELADCVERIRSVPGVRSGTRLEYARIYKDAIAPVGEVRGDVDELDRRLLAELETDGRMTFVELARRTGISSPTARQRVAALVRKNAVSFGSVHGLVEPGQRLLLEVGVRGAGPVGELVPSLLEDPELLFCGEVVGTYDLLLTLRTGGPEGAARAIDRLCATPGVGEIETWMHLRVWKELYAGSARGPR